jgi:hypothetical protein
MMNGNIFYSNGYKCIYLGLHRQPAEQETRHVVQFWGSPLKVIITNEQLKDLVEPKTNRSQHQENHE